MCAPAGEMRRLCANRGVRTNHVSATGSSAGTPFAMTGAVPDLLRAYGEMLRGEDDGLTRVFVAATASVTALVVLFAVGSLLGQLLKACRRAQSAHKRIGK